VPTVTKTFQLFTAIDNPIPALIFTVSGSETANLEFAIRNGEWWNDPANPGTQWHLAGVARYDAATTTSSMAATATTAAKKLYIRVTGSDTAMAFLIPADQVSAVDEAAQAGGFSTLPSGQRVNWDLVTSYSFA
jgi:hypothetical protein